MSNESHTPSPSADEIELDVEPGRPRPPVTFRDIFLALRDIFQFMKRKLS